MKFVYLYVCIFRNTICRKVCESFSQTWFFFWLIQYWQPYQKIHLHPILLMFTILKFIKFYAHQTIPFANLVLKILLLCHCIFATCLVLSWFCLVCSSSEFLYVQLVAVIVYAVCLLALNLWSRWTDWLVGAWIYGLHYSRLSLFAQFYGQILLGRVIKIIEYSVPDYCTCVSVHK